MNLIRLETRLLSQRGWLVHAVLPQLQDGGTAKMLSMFDDIYDATFIHQPEQSDIAINGEIQCLSCDEKFFPDMTGEVLDAALKDPITAPVECPACGASLEFLIDPLPTEEIGFGFTVVRG